jgi:hypothetical protein
MAAALEPAALSAPQIVVPAIDIKPTENVVRMADLIDDLRRRLGDAQMRARPRQKTVLNADEIAVCGALARTIWLAERKLVELALVFGEAESAIGQIETILDRKIRTSVLRAG